MTTDSENTGERAAPTGPPPDGHRSLGRWLLDMPRWKQGLVAAAVLAVAVGGTMALLHGGEPTLVQGGGPGGAGAGASALLPTGTGGTQPTGGASTAPAEPGAQGVFRLGFSFLVGFSVGAFVRTAVKMAAIAVGFFVVMLVLLEMGGFVTVNWEAIDQSWSGFWSQVGEEWGDFQRFMTGRLPAAGLAGLGLYAGLKRH